MAPIAASKLKPKMSWSVNIFVMAEKSNPINNPNTIKTSMKTILYYLDKNHTIKPVINLKERRCIIA